MSKNLTQGPEYWKVQRPAVELLRDKMGYLYADGEKEGTDATPEHANEIILSGRSSKAEVLLVDRLEAKLRDINPDISDDGIRQAIDALRLPNAMGMIEANEKLHRLLSRWVTVEETVNNQPVGRSVRYIDYENPENNEFLVVEEFTVNGPQYERRFDLAIFVNGIPIVAMECKRPDDEHGLEKAINDLLTYQDRIKGVPRFFHSVHFCLGSKGTQAAYGTVETPVKHYKIWKSTYPQTLDEFSKEIGHIPNEQEVMLGGLLRKENLLDMLRTFVVFDRQGGRNVKKIARYQQFEAVNEAIARITNPNSKEPLKLRGGVVWHTQGSGKSLSMLWLAIKLKRLPMLDNPTLLIVTDRKSLDRQITKTFRFCGFENPLQARSIKDLRRLLRVPHGQAVMTTVHKFNDFNDKKAGKKHPVLSTEKNIIVLIDEAHRTEYGIFHANLQRALPNACRLAFSGTPIPKTLRAFGPYIHKYTMPQSNEDGATVPILYEARLPELAIWGKQLDPMFRAITEGLSDEQRKQIVQQDANAIRIGGAPSRIEKIAFDIFQHYRDNFEADGFKAQVAACSQDAAKTYYEKLSQWMPDRVAVLISKPGDKGSDLVQLKEKFADEEDIIEQYLYEDVDKLAIIIVVDKYLTGFDAPPERVLYLDKPLRDHGLLQAIARVNRPLPEKNKTWGLIVDYWGVSKFLDKALKVFSEDLVIDQVMEDRSGDQAYRDLKKLRAEAFAFFPKDADRKNIEPWLLAIEKEDVRAHFLEAYRAFYRAIDRLLPDPRALDFLEDFAWLRRIRQELVAQYMEEDLDLADCSEKIRKLIDEHVKADEIKVLLEPVEILSDQFLSEIKKLSSDRAKASRMEGALSRTITSKKPQNPAFFESLQQRLERIIRDHRDSRIDDINEYKLLRKLREEMIAGQKQTAQALGLNERQFAFYGLMAKELDKDDSDSFEKDKLKDLTVEVLEAMEAEKVIDWVEKEDVKREMRRKIKRRLRLAGWPTDKLDATTNTLIDLAQVRLAK